MKTLKWFVICLLILGVASMAIAKPAVGMGKVPRKKAAIAETQSYNIPQEALDAAKAKFNPSAMRWGHYGVPASVVSLTGKSNPDPFNIRNGDTVDPAVSGDTEIWVYPSIPLDEDAETEIENLIGLIEDYNLQRGIENSLDIKLSKALESMNAVNLEQREDAINSLIAFIKECQAQSGNQLEVIEASTLISAANAIIHLLRGTSVDFGNLQWAVDNVAAGGTVQVQAMDLADPEPQYRVFNLESQDTSDIWNSMILVTRHVNIVGDKLPASNSANLWTESDPANQPFAIPGGTVDSDRAVIYNGSISFGYADWDDHTVPKPGSIKSVRFEKSTNVGILMLSALNMEVSDNIVTNVVPGLGAHDYPDMIGIAGAGAYGGLQGNSYIFQNNYVDLLGDDPDNDPDDSGLTYLSYVDGIMIGSIDLPGSQLSVIDNTVKNVPRIAIFIVDPTGAEPLTITGNYIKQRDFPKIAPNGDDPVWGDGIWALNTMIWEKNIPVIGAVIQNNTLENIPGHGILVYGLASSDISGNEIEKILLENGKAYKNSVDLGLQNLSGISVMWCGFTLIEIEGELVPDPAPNNIYNNTIYGTGAYAYYLEEYDLFNYIAIGEGELGEFDPAEGEAMPSGWPNPYKVFLGEITAFNTVDAPSLDCDDITNLGFNTIICTP